MSILFYSICFTLITFIIGLLTIPWNPGTDPHSPRTAREERLLFIMFIILIILIIYFLFIYSLFFS